MTWSQVANIIIAIYVAPLLTMRGRVFMAWFWAAFLIVNIATQLFAR